MYCITLKTHDIVHVYSLPAPPPKLAKMASQDSAESKVLQRHVHKLAKSLDPVVLSTILYAAEIIDDRIWEDSRLEIKAPNYDRCLKLLGAVIRCTKAKPSTFQVFCEALEQQEVTKDLAAQLRGKNYYKY